MEFICCAGRLVAEVVSVKTGLHVQKLQGNVCSGSWLTRPIQAKEGDVGWLACSQMLHEQPQVSSHGLHLVLQGLDSVVHALHLRDDADDPKIDGLFNGRSY